MASNNKWTESFSYIFNKYIKKYVSIDRLWYIWTWPSFIHFEIGNSAGTKLKDKANPASFVNIKFPERVFTHNILEQLRGGKSNAELINDVNYLKFVYPYFKEQVEYLLKIAKKNDLLLKITGDSVWET